MAALQYVDTPSYAALLLRRTFPELEGADGLISQSLEWLGPHRPAVHWNADKHRWTFPSGAIIQFGHMESEADKTRYQGQAYQFIGFDELTHFTESQYDYVGFTRQRRRTGMRDLGIPNRVRSASNPGGTGHGWVKERFITDRKDGVIFVPAKLRDNPGLDADDYEESFKNVPDALRKQLLEGDWDAFEGAAFTLKPDHLIDAPQIPSWWERFESMDYGLKNPTAWHFWAIDGDGNLICFYTYYKPGMPSETSPAIRNLRSKFGSSICFGDPASLAQPTTTHTRLGAQATIQTEFAEQGVGIAKANNNPRTGFTRLNEFLRLDRQHRFPDWHPRRGDYGAPRMFIVERYCPQLVKQLKEAPLQPLEARHGGEMVEPKWESAHGHAVAAARYGVLSRFPASEAPSALPDDPRAAWLVQYEQEQEEQDRSTPYTVV